MNWFTRKKQNIEQNTKKDLPSDLWRKCSCEEILYNPELEASFSICHHCNFHFPISSKKYQEIILDGEAEVFLHIKRSHVIYLETKDLGVKQYLQVRFNLNLLPLLEV